MPTRAQELIGEECDRIKELLIAKNREYGNSALEPVGIFAMGNAIEQLEVRIDDKLKRIKTTRDMSDTEIHEDTELDLLGYLVLLRVARRLS